MAADEAVAEVIGPIVAAAEFDLEGVSIRPAGRLSRVVITVDADVVDSDNLAALSHAISAALDDTAVMGEQPYTLEVSSRGVDAPLTTPTHWRRNRTRLVRIQPVTGDVVVGRIGDSDDAGVTVDDQRWAYCDIAKATVEIEFNPRKDA